MSGYKILITNDDGIQAEGIKLLIKEATKYGTVLVVAPKTEQSAKSHALTLRTHFEVGKIDTLGVDAYYVDSTPADCVRYAYYGLNYDFDILLSGVNKGYNVGYDIMYSGTCAAAFEASSLNKISIAVSSHADSFEGFINYASMVYKFFKDNKLIDKWQMYNINFPISPKGIRVTSQGYCNFVTYFVDNGNGKCQVGDNITDNNPNNLHLDTSCVMNNYVSITPLTHERTKYEVYDTIKNLKYDE